MSKSIQGLEHKLRVPDFVQQEVLSLILPMEQQFNQFVADVQNALSLIYVPKAARSEKIQFDPMQAAVVLARLQELLAQDDTRVNSVWLESEAILEAVLGLEANLLKLYINEFKYDQALQHLRKIIPGLGLGSRV